MSIETAIEKAEREMREATKRSAEKRKKLLADLQLTEQEVAQQGVIRSLTPTFKEETKQPAPPPHTHDLCSAFAQCLGGGGGGGGGGRAAPAAPPPPLIKEPSRHHEGSKMLIEAKKGMVERQRSDVSRRRRAVQAAFEAEISENRSARGDELLNKESGKARSDMWTMLSQQVESGIGPPTEEQLELLWRKYDSNADGTLSKRELGPRRHLAASRPTVPHDPRGTPRPAARLTRPAALYTSDPRGTPTAARAPPAPRGAAPATPRTHRGCPTAPQRR